MGTQNRPRRCFADGINQSLDSSSVQTKFCNFMQSGIFEKCFRPDALLMDRYEGQNCLILCKNRRSEAQLGLIFIIHQIFSNLVARIGAEIDISLLCPLFDRNINTEQNSRCTKQIARESKRVNGSSG